MIKEGEKNAIHMVYKRTKIFRFERVSMYRAIGQKPKIAWEMKGFHMF
jgi:hypothetical protein